MHKKRKIRCQAAFMPFIPLHRVDPHSRDTETKLVGLCVCIMLRLLYTHLWLICVWDVDQNLQLIRQE